MLLAGGALPTSALTCVSLYVSFLLCLPWASSQDYHLQQGGQLRKSKEQKVKTAGATSQAAKAGKTQKDGPSSKLRSRHSTTLSLALATPPRRRLQSLSAPFTESAIANSIRPLSLVPLLPKGIHAPWQKLPSTASQSQPSSTNVYSSTFSLSLLLALSHLSFLSLTHIPPSRRTPILAYSHILPPRPVPPGARQHLFLEARSQPPLLAFDVNSDLQLENKSSSLSLFSVIISLRIVPDDTYTDVTERASRRPLSSQSQQSSPEPLNLSILPHRP